MAEPVDLLVAGGGPAGSAAALRALQVRPDARVRILDAATFPRDKACGDGIAPHAVAELCSLGAPEAVSGYAPVAWLRLRSPGGVDVAAPPAQANAVVPRLVFDARLIRAAQDRGAELVHERVRTVERHRDRVVVNGRHEARVLVGADGATSTVRRSLGLPRNRDRDLAIAVRGYARAPGGVPEQLIHMVADGWPAYAWSFPVGDGTANVGYGKLRTQLGGEGRNALWGPLAEILPDQPADPDTLRAHHLPLSTWRPRQPDGRVLLAGDAASLINPLTGEGIYYAVLSGRLAGSAAMLDPDDPGRAYRRALARELGAHLRQTTVLARLAQKAGFVDAVMGVAARRREVFDVLVDLGLGRGTVPPLMLADVVRGWARVSSSLTRPR